jgi:hypothetical protein
MPKLIACVAGLVALIAGIFGNVEPSLCLQRALISLIVGWCLGALWQAVSGNPVQLQVLQPKTNESTNGRDDAEAA